MRRIWILILGAGLLAAIAAGVGTRLPEDVGGMAPERSIAYLIAAGLAGICYCGALTLVGQASRALPSILLVAGLARVLTFLPPPLLSTDIYRYVWDGAVQRAGINPYRYIPADPALAGLRDHGSGPEALYPNINRAETAPTIYPPFAQMLFAAAAWAWPGLWGVKAMLLLFDLVSIGALLLLLRDAGLPAERVLIYAWNPLVIWEFAGGGHIDAAATGLVALAMLAAVRGRGGWAGAVLGLAVITKLLPAALFPAFWRRWDRRVPMAALAVILAGYAVYAGAGLKMFGYLPGYAAEERLGQDGPFLLRLWGAFTPVPGWAPVTYAALALALLATLAAWVVRHPLPTARPARVLRIAGAVLLLGTTVLAVLSPHYPWYWAGLALPLVFVPAPAVVWFTLAAPILYLDPRHDEVIWPVILFLPFAGLLLGSLLRRVLMKEQSDVQHPA